VEDQSHLVGQWRAATGPVRRQLALMPLDQVLCLSTRAVETVIEPLGGTIGDVGNDVADVETFSRRLDPCHDAAGMRPRFCTITRHGVVAHHIQIGGRAPDTDVIGLDGLFPGGLTLMMGTRLLRVAQNSRQNPSNEATISGQIVRYLNRTYRVLPTRWQATLSLAGDPGPIVRFVVFTQQSGCVCS
jgi:hypothetical protein